MLFAPGLWLTVPDQLAGKAAINDCRLSNPSGQVGAQSFKLLIIGFWNGECPMLCNFALVRAAATAGALALFSSVAFSQTSEDTSVETTAILGAHLVDLEGGEVIRNAAVLIEGETIAAVGPGGDIEIPIEARTLRLDGKWLLPGMMNMHVHPGLLLPGRMAAELANETEAELTLRMAKNARKSLYAGTTTIRLPGVNTGPNEQLTSHADFAVKRAIESGEIEGPRIFTAGISVIPTGGHGSERGEKGVDGPTQIREHVRAQIAEGASWIKLMISRGIASRRGDIAKADISPDEMRIAIDEAHRRGAKVTAHNGSPIAAMEAMDAGIDGFEHGYYFTEEVFRRMKTEGTWYVPTIVVAQEGVMPFFEKIGSPDWYLERVEAVGEKHWQALETAIDVGVNIAMGSDQLPYEPNSGTVASVRETELYAEAGMSNLEALRAAMAHPAKMLGEEKLGALAPGKYADIIAVDSNPLEDISALRSIGFVMKGGRVVRRDGAGAEDAE